MGEVPDNLAATLLACRRNVRNDQDRFLLPRWSSTPSNKHEGLPPMAGTRRAASWWAGTPRTSGPAALRFNAGSGQRSAVDLPRYKTCTISRGCRIRSKTSSWFTRCCVATDVPDNFDLDVNTVYALLHDQTRGDVATLAERVDPIVEMLDIAAGGPSSSRNVRSSRPTSDPVISPMRYGKTPVDVVFKCIEHPRPISNAPHQAKATAPATLAGFLAQSLAETLASLVMVHSIEPGFPMVFSNWPLVIDLRTGAFVGGGAETTAQRGLGAALQLAGAVLRAWPVP